MPWPRPRQGGGGAWGAWSRRSGTPVVSIDRLLCMLYYLVYVFGKAEGHARAWVIEDLSMPYLVEAAHDPEVVGQDANLCTTALACCHH